MPTDSNQPSGGAQTVTLDLTDQAAAEAAISQLSDHARTLLFDATRQCQYQIAANHTAILDQVRATLSDYQSGAEVVGALFPAVEFDEGYYISTATTVVFLADGDSDYASLDFPQSLHTLFGQTPGEVTIDAHLLVDLRRDDVQKIRQDSPDLKFIDAVSDFLMRPTQDPHD